MVPRYIVIHHSATEAAITFDMIRQNHLERGWDDIGYHYVIDQEGSIFTGRAEDVIGAHALGLNKESLGICCIGNFEEETPQDKQLNVLIKIVQQLAEKYQISREKIIGHRDVTSEARENKRSKCPGENLYLLLDKIRSGVKA